MIEAGDLIKIAQRLDLGLAEPDADCPLPWLELRYFRRDDNEIDVHATRIVRALVRERLGGFPLDAIGAAVLADIDAKSST